MSKMKDWETGASACFFGKLDPETLEQYAKGGVSCIELSFSYRAYYEDLQFVRRSGEIARQAADAGVRLHSIHLPFSRELDVSHPDREKRDFTVKTNLELIDAAAKAGIGIAVVHPSSEPIDEADRPARLELSRANLVRLAEHARSCGMRLAVENLPRTCLCRNSGDMKFILAGSDDLYTVFDTNHLLMQDNVEFIRDIGSKIITLHVSDYDFIDERHQMPLEGKNDWKRIIHALEDTGYNGPWLYELGSKGIYTASDLVDNHRKLAALCGEI